MKKQFKPIPTRKKSMHSKNNSSTLPILKKATTLKNLIDNIEKDNENQLNQEIINEESDSDSENQNQNNETNIFKTNSIHNSFHSIHKNSLSNLPFTRTNTQNINLHLNPMQIKINPWNIFYQNRINPEGYLISSWFYFIMFTILYHTILLPFVACFKSEIARDPVSKYKHTRNNINIIFYYFSLLSNTVYLFLFFFFVIFFILVIFLDYFFDFCYCLDIILRCFRAFYDDWCILIMDKKLIWEKCVNEGLYFDLISIFPLELFLLISFQWGSIPFACGRLIRIFRIRRLFSHELDSIYVGIRLLRK
jgi:hypothetical protein